MFVWFGDHGYYPVRDPIGVYDEDYFHKYVGYELTALGSKITDARVEMVSRHIDPAEEVIDVGIGSGHFIERRGAETYGFDINPVAIKWLQDNDKWKNPYYEGVENLTFWDSLEHLQDPAALVKRAGNLIFVSMPIYNSQQHCLNSKHFRPDEHFWYFTRDGLVKWFERLGFSLLEENDVESQLGREDIMNFAFGKDQICSL
jgi:hypothetical protein